MLFTTWIQNVIVPKTFHVCSILEQQLPHVISAYVSVGHSWSKLFMNPSTSIFLETYTYGKEKWHFVDEEIRIPQSTWGPELHAYKNTTVKFDFVYSCSEENSFVPQGVEKFYCRRDHPLFVC